VQCNPPDTRAMRHVRASATRPRVTRLDGG
jgi:hypothetical protein